jgi:hypothetical protein
MGSGSEFLGTQVLYHARNTNAGAQIIADGVMLSGGSRMFDAGIYFAETRELARHKSAHEGGMTAVIIEAEADMSTALILESASRGLNSGELHLCGCDSVKGRGSPTLAGNTLCMSQNEFEFLGPKDYLRRPHQDVRRPRRLTSLG